MSTIYTEDQLQALAGGPNKKEIIALLKGYGKGIQEILGMSEAERIAAILSLQPKAGGAKAGAAKAAPGKAAPAAKATPAAAGKTPVGKGKVKEPEPEPEEAASEGGSVDLSEVTARLDAAAEANAALQGTVEALAGQLGSAMGILLDAHFLIRALIGASGLSAEDLEELKEGYYATLVVEPEAVEEGN